MTTWTIQTTENGGMQPVTAILTASTSTYLKQLVTTLNFTNPAVPTAVRNEINSQGLNCDAVMIMNVVTSGSGSTTFTINAAESGLLSEDPGGLSNGVLAVFDPSNSLCLVSVPTKGKVIGEFV